MTLRALSLYRRARKMGRSANEVPRIQVVLKLPRYQVPSFITRARLILTKMTDNPWFPSPSPPLAELAAAVDALSQAEVVRLTGLHGSVPARNKKRQDVKGILERLAFYVETIANANLENAYAIVESAGLFVKNSRGRSPVLFHAELTGIRGQVRVIAPSAGDRAGYEFQYSLDGGKTWLPFPQQFTNHSTAMLPGLTPGSTVHFRYRVTIRAVTGNWIGPVWIRLE
jgi:hypothetical protein